MTENIPEFGIKRENEERRDGGCAVIFDPLSQKYAVNHIAQSGLFGLFGGGVDLNDDIQTGVLREVVEESGLNDFLYVEKIADALTHYYNVLKNINRLARATCFLIILKSRNQIEVKREEHENFELAWVSADELIENWESKNQEKSYDHWIYFMNKSVNRAIELGYDKISKTR